ncbi:MAG: hypothetical protein ABT20_06920 [Rubrivivax sp. SCN 70-15]|nr:MAG: hypothetical protein ABT20_06920 [Rubrivivax sp. SCN 70-15]
MSTISPALSSDHRRGIDASSTSPWLRAAHKAQGPHQWPMRARAPASSARSRQSASLAPIMRALRRRMVGISATMRRRSQPISRPASAPSNCCCRTRWRSESCASLVAVMSVRIDRYCRPSPDGELTGVIVVDTQYRLPSLRRLHSSPCQVAPARIVRHSVA